MPSAAHPSDPSTETGRWGADLGYPHAAHRPDAPETDGGRHAATTQRTEPSPRKDAPMPERASAPANPSAPTPSNPTVHTPGARLARSILTGTVILGSVAISAGAAWVSFLAIRDLALYFGWDQHTAWVVMPLIELFLLVGSSEAALRILGGISHPIAPYVAAYTALVVTLACNIGDHVLRLYDEQPGIRTWRLVILGLFAAIVPAAQIGALHFLSGRLRRIAEGRQQRAATMADRVPGYARQISSALGARLLDAVQTPSVRPGPDVPAAVVDAESETPSAPAPSRRVPTVRPAVPVQTGRPSATLHLVPEDFSDTVRANAAELRERFPDGLPEWKGKPSGRAVREAMAWSNDKAAPAIRAYQAGADLEPSTKEQTS